MKDPFPFFIEPKNEDERFMIEALKEAWKAFQKKEVPVGAVLVHEGRVIARGHNQVEMLKDATAHAEMLCITSGESALENWRLAGTTLYVTMEPCSMCSGALLLARVPRVVWGAPDFRHGANGSLIDLFAIEHPTHRIEITQKVLAEPCGTLMKEFFQKRRLDPTLASSKGKETEKSSSECQKSGCLGTAHQKPGKEISLVSSLATLTEMAEHQRKELLKLGRRIVPTLTSEDVLQPNDYPELEHHPDFRYEEGVLAGILAAEAALRA